MKKYILLLFLFMLPIIVKGEELQPNFNATSFDILTNEEISIRDINNIIYMYQVEKSYLVNAKINGFFLNVKALEISGKGFVLLRNRIDGSNIKIYFNILGGNIKIKFNDKLNNFEGSKFNVYYNDELKDVIIINNENYGISKNLLSGIYKIEQLSTIQGFKKSIVKEVLVGHTGTTSLTITNKIIVTNLKIIKSYNNILEENIKFNIYDENNMIINSCLTNINGFCQLLLNYGIYFIKQENTFHNEELYVNKVIVDEEINENYEILINTINSEGNEIIEDNSEETEINEEDNLNNNEKNIEENPKTSDNFIKIFGIWIISFISILFIFKKLLINKSY